MKLWLEVSILVVPRKSLYLAHSLSLTNFNSKTFMREKQIGVCLGIEKTMEFTILKTFW